MADFRGPLAVGLLAAAVGLLAVFWAVRRLAGPVFAHELTVLARRGQQPKLRAGLTLLLLLFLLLGYVSTFGWDALTGRPPTIDPRSGRFAERFAITVLAAQLLAVMVLTPAVVGSAMTEERDRGTLDLLRTTALTDREIAVGKLLARLAVVAAVGSAGLPVLALALLFGGVDPRLVLQVYAVTAGAGFGLGAWSLYLGTVRGSLRGVLATVYVWQIVLCVVGSCVIVSVPGFAGFSPPALCYVLLGWDTMSWLWTAKGWWAGVTIYAMLYGGGGLLAAWLAIGRVRVAAVRRSDDAAAVRLGMRRFYARPLADDDDPLVWREREFADRRFGGGELRIGCGFFLLFLLGSGLFIIGAQAIESRTWIAQGVASIARPVLAVAAFALPLGLALRLAAAVAGEREQQTLDALLMLPGDRRHLLRAKLWAAGLWLCWPLLVAATLLAGGLLVGANGLVGTVLAGGQLLAAAGFAVGLAGFLTVRAATAGRATVWVLVGLLTVQVGPQVLAPLAELFGFGEVVRTASPPAAVWASLGGAGVAAVLPATVNAVIGGLLWRAAERRLEGLGS